MVNKTLCLLIKKKGFLKHFNIYNFGVCSGDIKKHTMHARSGSGCWENIYKNVLFLKQPL